MKLGKYKIIAVLGEGSMGVVYKAIDPDIQEYVALKTIHKKLLEDKNRAVVLQRFINEVKAGRLLRHPNIVAMYDYQEDEETCFLVMEYVEGTTLKEDMWENPNLSQQVILRIMNELLDGLQAAHKQGVVHRDIKPENLILKDNGDVRIADFGVARLDSSTITTDGSILGSPAYMSPEQCMGKQVDPRSDLFSAGVILYQMLTGEKPFSGMAFMETMQQILNVNPDLPSKRNPALGLQWDRVVTKALAKHPDDRYQSAADFQQALKGCVVIKDNKKDGKSSRFFKKSSRINRILTKTLIYMGYFRAFTVDLFLTKQFLRTIGVDQNIDKQPHKIRRSTLWLGFGLVFAALGTGGYWITQSQTAVDDNQNLTATKNTPKVKAEKTDLLNQQLKQLLTDYQCDQLLYTMDSNMTISVSGYVSEINEQALQKDLSNLATTSNQQLDMKLTPLVDQNCELLSALQTFVQRNSLQKHGLQIEPSQHDSVFVEGERPIFEVITPDFPGYLYVDYFMADGKVFHLLPTNKKSQQKTNAEQLILIGKEGTTRQWEIVKPYGKEIMSVIVSKSPLFETVRDEIETSEVYSSALRLALFENKDTVITADYFVITTISLADAQ
ncbi:MAG: serine/threonine-protein kinase [Methylococcales bacterium]